MVKTLDQWRAPKAAVPAALLSVSADVAAIAAVAAPPAAETLDLEPVPAYAPGNGQSDLYVVAKTRAKTESVGRALVLQPPSEADAIAELDWFVPENARGDEADPRWQLVGSPVVVVAAMKCFSGAISRTRGKVSF